MRDTYYAVVAREATRNLGVRNLGVRALHTTYRRTKRAVGSLQSLTLVRYDRVYDSVLDAVIGAVREHT